MEFNKLSKILAVIIVMLGMWIYLLRQEVDSNYDTKLIKQLADSLSDRNDELQGRILIEREKISFFAKMVDSLESQTHQIHVAYENKIRQINNAPVDTLIHEFSVILTESNSPVER